MAAAEGDMMMMAYGTGGIVLGYKDAICRNRNISHVTTLPVPSLAGPATMYSTTIWLCCRCKYVEGCNSTVLHVLAYNPARPYH